MCAHGPSIVCFMQSTVVDIHLMSIESGMGERVREEEREEEREKLKEKRGKSFFSCSLLSGDRQECNERNWQSDVILVRVKHRTQAFASM